MSLSSSPLRRRARPARLAAVALTLALTGGLAACGSDDDPEPAAAASTTSTATASSPDLSGVTLRVAVEDSGGWDLELKQAKVDDFPYKVKYVRLATGNLVVQALASGAIDVGRTSDIPPLFAPPGKVKVVGFQNQPYVQAPGGFEVLAPKGSSIAKPADLKGKSVGYTEATATQYTLQKVLEQGGLKWADIKPVKLTLPDGLAALRSKKVDALATLGQPDLLARQAGAQPIGDYSKAFTSGNTLVASSPDTLADVGKAAAIKDLLGRLQKATAWETANPEAWIKAQTDAQRTDYNASLSRFKATLAAGPITWSGPTPAAIAAEQDVADAFAQSGSLKQPVDVSAAWDDALSSAFTSAK